MTVYLTQDEVAAAAISALRLRREFTGKHVAELAAVIDAGKVRYQVILFDTAKAAQDYAAGNPDAEDAVPTAAQPQGETPHG